MPSAAVAIARRDRLVVAGALALVLVFAWAYLIYLGRQMSAQMADEVAMVAMGMAADAAWTPADRAFIFAMWVVMMIGMMAGSAAPVLMLFTGSIRTRNAARPSLGTFVFGMGYLLVWIGFSACATAAQWALHGAAMLGPEMATRGPWLGGTVLVLVGLYQLTPWKGACLTQCRSPLGFLMTNWREGLAGALRMGAGHGWYCLGCCWALMAVLFVVGVMNLFWVAALSALVLLEKVTPAGALVARVAGVLLIAAGAALAAGAF